MKSLEEKRLVESIENGEWVPVAKREDLKKSLRKAAKNTILKNFSMNIKVSQKDIRHLKAKALEEGVQYQALVSSVLHKYITGKLVEQK